jgi:hypothetical protein
MILVAAMIAGTAVAALLLAVIAFSRNGVVDTSGRGGNLRVLWIVLLVAALAGSLSRAEARSEFSDARPYMRQYATCAIGAYRRDALALVTSTLDASKFERKFPQLVMRNVIIEIPICQPPLILPVNVPVSFDGEPLRMALAEALIVRDFANVDPRTLASAPPLPVMEVESRAAFESMLSKVSNPTRRTEREQAYGRALMIVWLAQFSECAVRREPGAAKAWIMTTSGSTAEMASAQAMSASFGACLQEGETLSFDKELLRGTIAVAYVRLAASLPRSVSGTR